MNANLFAKIYICVFRNFRIRVDLRRFHKSFPVLSLTDIFLWRKWQNGAKNEELWLVKSVCIKTIFSRDAEPTIRKHKKQTVVGPCFSHRKSCFSSTVFYILYEVSFNVSLLILRARNMLLELCYGSRLSSQPRGWNIIYLRGSSEMNHRLLKRFNEEIIALWIFSSRPFFIEIDFENERQVLVRTVTLSRNRSRKRAESHCKISRK